MDQRKEAKLPKEPSENPPVVSTHVSQLGSARRALLMTCQIQVISPNGMITKARALLDSASSASFITERLAQHLRLPRRHHNLRMSGIGGSLTQMNTRGIVKLNISRVGQGGKIMDVEAIVLPKVTSDLPTHAISFQQEWKHLTRLDLADPEFGTPGRVDLLLGTEVFSRAVLHGRRYGPPGTPSAFKTCFGWVLAGTVQGDQDQLPAYTCCHVSVDSILKRFWEIEEFNPQQPIFSLEEKSVMKHFKENHIRDDKGRYIVSLPRKIDVESLGESRPQAVRRFLTLERSLRSKEQFQDFADAMHEYFEMDHAELIPASEIKKPCTEAYYLPMHCVRKEESSTSKVRVVFDASAKTTSGVSLNDQLMVGPTLHPQLIDVLLRFRSHKVALTADVSRMYRAVLLHKDQRDLHRFVWRGDPQQSLQDYRMTRLTFGVCASSFAANMAMRQNAIDHAESHPRATQVVLDSFYVDDGLMGADSVQEAIELRNEIQELFDQGGFNLRKWKSSEQRVLDQIPLQLRDSQTKQEITCDREFTKVLGVEWNATVDSFRPVITSLPVRETLTKRALSSDIARLFDVMG